MRHGPGQPRLFAVTSTRQTEGTGTCSGSLAGARLFPPGQLRSMRLCRRDLIEVRLPPQGNSTGYPRWAQEAAACRLGLVGSTDAGRGWGRKCVLLKATCRPQPFLRLPPLWAEHEGSIHPCQIASLSLPEEQQGLLGTALQE